MLFYEKIENDKKEWLLVLKSSINDISIFEKQVGNFSREYNLILIDLPGFGVNKEYKEVFNIEDIAKSINDILEKLEIKKVYLLGISLGSIVASKFCIKYPEKVNKMVLAEFIAGYSNIVIESGWYVFSKLKKIMLKKVNIMLYIKVILPGKKNKEFRKMFLKNVIGMKKTQLYSWMDLITAYFGEYNKSGKKELASLNIPKMYLIGKKDKAFVSKIKKSIIEDEGNKLTTIDSVGHLCHIHADKEFQKNILTFLSVK